MPPIAHSKLGASGSKRWINCPGSVRECAGIPNKSSVYADEGTAAHFLGEQCLRQDKDAVEFIGRKIAVFDQEEPCFVGEVEEEQFSLERVFEVTDDMVEAVQVYLDTIRDIKSRNPGCEVRIEHKFHLADLHEDLWGTADCVIVVPFDRTIVLDYKHGQGVAVDVKENPQGMMYALGAAANEDLETIEIVIVQPRAPHPQGPVRRWTTTRTALLDWGHNVLLPAALATGEPDTPLHAGDWCRFCPAGAVCPEKCRAAFANAPVLLAEDNYPAPLAQQPAFPDPRSLTPEQASRILAAWPLAESYVADVKAYVRESLLSGDFKPGEAGCELKLVQGKKGNRKYSNEKEAQTVLFSVLRAQANDVKTVSPAEAVRRIKTGLKNNTIKEERLRGLSPQEFVDQLVYRPDGGLQLVSFDDPRPAVVPQKAEEVFETYDVEVIPAAAIECNPNDF